MNLTIEEIKLMLGEKDLIIYQLSKRINELEQVVREKEPLVTKCKPENEEAKVFDMRRN